MTRRIDVERWKDIPAGTRLWVREAWRAPASFNDLTGGKIQEAALEIGYGRAWCPVRYEADGAIIHKSEWKGETGRYRHARYMPRYLSRLTLIVKAVKVERLNEITEEDALAEGIWAEQMAHCPLYHSGAEDREGPITALTAITCYSRLWEHINGPGSWEANPWVAAITFDVHKTNIDAMEKAA